MPANPEAQVGYRPTLDPYPPREIVAFTIVLNGMPFIKRHLDVFQKVKGVGVRWVIVEGAAANTGSTAWCKEQPLRGSVDGTREYLQEIESPESVTVISRDLWKNKDEMVNAALEKIDAPCILMEVDSDEVYNPAAIERIWKAFKEDQNLGAITIPCTYWVGRDIICQGENCWSNRANEYVRAWRYESGMRFLSHEPPVLDRDLGRMMGRDEARAKGISFNHYAYVTEEQIRFKEQFYGYTGLLNQWLALQANTVWPTQLGRFFPFADGGTMVTKRDITDGSYL